MHENLQRQHPHRAGSPRAFGLLLVALLILAALYPLLDRNAPRWWALGFAAVALIGALVAPSIYAVPNRAWIRLGALLAQIVSPVALLIIFYGVFVPAGWLMRLFGRKPLALAYEPEAESYWIARNPPGPGGESLKNPF